MTADNSFTMNNSDVSSSSYLNYYQPLSKPNWIIMEKYDSPTSSDDMDCTKNLRVKHLKIIDLRLTYRKRQSGHINERTVHISGFKDKKKQYMKLDREITKRFDRIP